MRTALRRARQEMGLSQEALGRKVGVTGAFICQIERGQRVPSVNLALAIAREVGRSVEELFFVMGIDDASSPLPGGAL